MFNARFREAVLRWLEKIGIPRSILHHWEKCIGSEAFRCIRNSSRESDSDRQKKSRRRRMKVAGACVVGGLALAITGGLAAPAVAGAMTIVGTGVGGTVGAAVVTIGTIVGGLGSAGALVVFGAGGAGLAGWKMSNKVGALQEFEFIPLANQAYGDEPRTETGARCAELLDEVGVSLTFSNGAPMGIGLTRLRVTSVTEGSQADKHGVKEGWVVTHVEGDVVEGGAQGFLDARTRIPASQTAFEVTFLRPSQEVVAAEAEKAEEEVVDDTDEYEVVEEQCADSVQVVVCVHGWLSECGEVTDSFLAVPRAIFPCSDVYALAWDTKHLRKLGGFMYSVARSKVADSVTQNWIRGTIASVSTATAASLVLPMWVVSSLSNIDNAWAIVRDRTEQAGVCLATALCDEAAVGRRPVTLVGFSMGARVIFRALEELHAKKKFNVVADVILMGAPVSTTWTEERVAKVAINNKRGQWSKARAVVSGRFVNCYSRKDWILGALYRYMEWGICVAGLGPVPIAGVENIDVTTLVHRHEEYADRVEDILRLAQFTSTTSRS